MYEQVLKKESKREVEGVKSERETMIRSNA